jgi:hypothetical protein
VLLTYRDFRRFDPIDRPLDKLLSKLKRDGHDIAGAAAQYDLMLSVMETMDWQGSSTRSERYSPSWKTWASMSAKLDGFRSKVRIYALQGNAYPPLQLDEVHNANPISEAVA